MRAILHSRLKVLILGACALMALLPNGQSGGVGLPPRLNAQALSCPDVVKQALDLVVNECGDLERNKVCYGNILLDATPKEGIDPQTFAFSQPGDTVPIRDLGTLKLTQFNAETGTWGVAALRAQANLPGTGVGQAVTMILFGDTEVTDASEEQDGTFKAFYLRTGLGKPGCEEMPRNGVLLQSPKGGQKVEMTANGVNLKIGSTVFLFADAAEGEEDPQLWIHTIEGEVEVTSDEVAVIVEAGKQACVPLKDDDAGNPEIDPAGPPCAPEDLDEEETKGLPTDPLTELYARHIAYDTQTLPTLTATVTNTTPPVVRRRTRTFTPSPTASTTPLPPQPPPPTAAPTSTPNGTITATNTASASPTPSATSSPSASPTFTFTPLPTDTLTPLPTDTPTFTWTPTPTETFTPMPTDTFTPMPTDTFTPMPTDTFTPMPTDTPTPPADTCAIASFSASPSEAMFGESVTLSWTVIGAVNTTTLISMFGDRTSVSFSGSQVITFGINEGFTETWTLEAQCVDASVAVATTMISPLPSE